MNPDLVGILACPDCGSTLVVLATQSVETSGIAAGELRCSNNHAFPIRAGVPRFVFSDAYAENFGFEWTVHSTAQLDTESRTESEQSFREKTGFSPDELAGKLVLDVGCGMGRFSEVASRWGARVVGVDLTTAIDAANRNIGSRLNVSLIQADAFRLPFREQTFDFIFSIGVLHHTPNTRAAFSRLPRLLKPGGRIAIWVYSSELMRWAWSSDLYRTVTKRLPKEFLHSLCRIAVPMYRVNKLPVIGSVTRVILPMSVHPDPEWRVLDTFDWYSPKYQWKHSLPEVRSWFEQEGLVDLEPLPVPVSVRGTRPANGSTV